MNETAANEVNEETRKTSNKTKLGISVNLLSALIFFMAVFFNFSDSGFILLAAVCAYVLIVEKDSGLKRNAVKAFLIGILVAVINVLVNLIPDVFNILAGLIPDGAARFSISYASFVDVLRTGADIIVSLIAKVKAVVLIILGIKALGGGSFTIPVVDKLIDKHMNNDARE